MENELGVQPLRLPRLLHETERVPTELPPLQVAPSRLREFGDIQVSRGRVFHAIQGVVDPSGRTHTRKKPTS